MVGHSPTPNPKGRDPYLASFLAKCTGCKTCTEWNPEPNPANPFVVRCNGCACYASRHRPRSRNSSSENPAVNPAGIRRFLPWDTERKAVLTQNGSKFQPATPRTVHEDSLAASTSVTSTAEQANQHNAPSPGMNAPSTSAAIVHVTPSGELSANQVLQTIQQTNRHIVITRRVKPGKDVQNSEQSSTLSGCQSPPPPMNQGKAPSAGEGTSAVSAATAPSATSQTNQVPPRTRSTNKRTAQPAAEEIPSTSGYSATSSAAAEPAAVALNPIEFSFEAPSKRKKNPEEKCPFAALGCPKMFRTAADRRDREKHVKSHQTKTEHKCIFCGFFGSNKAGLRSHVAMHERTKK